jgi:hypothetical protein
VPPPKKVPETDAIFERLKEVHEQAAGAPDTLRISMDAKATIKLGPFARGGYSRVGTRAIDHDFQPQGTLTPFGLFLPDHDELDLYFASTKVTSDFMMDMVEDYWERHRERFAPVRRLILDLDNGPENQSHRSQFVHRLVAFAQKTGLTVQLAYYPPYHSKYNPIERCWGVLENYWRGELLDSVAKVLGLAQRMTYNGKHPTVQWVTQEYAKGVRRSKAEMRILEKQMDRWPGLEKYSVEILPEPGPDI